MPSEPDWILPTPNENKVHNLHANLRIPVPIAEILINRGITEPNRTERYLHPTLAELHSPELLPDFRPAVQRLLMAIDTGEQILVYADRDVDGSCGGAILVDLFQMLGAHVDFDTPGKWDGFGINDEAVNEIIEADVDLLVTVDCGTTATEELARVQTAGVDVLITDHHDPPSNLPPSIGCINPRRDGSEYPNTDLAGGAVAYKLGRGLVDARDPDHLDTYRRSALPLAALATVGDYVSLTTENRALVRGGYRRLWDSRLPGLIAAAENRDVDGIQDLRWPLSSFLNAAQEDEEGGLLIELLLAQDIARIEEILETIEVYSTTRQADRKERKAHLESCFREQVYPEDQFLYLVETDQFVGGGPMNDLSEEWGRPVITYREQKEHYRGGARSDPPVDFLELFEACEDHLLDYWGHPGAAGFRVAREDMDRFEQSLRRALTERYDEDEMRPKVEIDAKLGLHDIDHDLLDYLNELRPFGPGNEEPKFLLEAVEVDGVERFGDQDAHCKLYPANAEGVVFLIWDEGRSIAQINHPSIYDLVGTLDFDDYDSQPVLTVSEYRTRG